MKEINNAIERICNHLGLSNSREMAIKNNHEYFVFLESAAIYGGYRLVRVNVKTGSHLGVFGKSSICPRLSKKEFTAYIEGLKDYLLYSKFD